MDKSIFSPSQSGRLIYLPFILLLTFGSVASRVSGMQTQAVQDRIRNLFRLPQPMVPPKVPALPVPPLSEAPALPKGAPVPPPLPPEVPALAAPAPPAPPKVPAVPRL